MRTTIYKCDKCGKEDTDNKVLDLDIVGVFVGRYERSYTYGTEPRVELKKDWCIDCRISFGLKEKPKDSPIQVTQITLEDMVREIAYKAACNAIINRGQ
jgi:hypothetical protein